MWWSSSIWYFVPKTASRAFSAVTPVVSLSPAFERILQSFSVWMLSSSMLSRSSQILKMLYPTVSWRVVPANFTVILSTSARETFCTRELLVSPPARSMLKLIAREPGTRTSFSFSLGTETYRVLPGLASLSIKGNALNRALGLHGSECFFCKCRMQSFLHSHRVLIAEIIFFNWKYKSTKTFFTMAEGGGFENPAYDPDDPEVPGNDDDDNEDQQDHDETTPFWPGSASTPGPSGEEIPMQTMLERAKEFIRRTFPRVDFGKMDPIGFGKKKGNETTIVSFGSKGGETEIFRKHGWSLLKIFTDKFKTALGPEAESLIAQ